MGEEDLFWQQQQDERNFQQSRLAVEQKNQGVILDQETKNIVKEQLDLTEEITTIQNLLRGRVQVPDEEGILFWRNPTSNDDVLLTEAGINLVLNTIQWYMNKNTLLSNYDEKTIYEKMEDFSTALADAIFMNYEKYFLYPTPEDCQKKLIERLKKKQEAIEFNLKLQGHSPDKDKIWKQLIDEIDPQVERDKIKEQLIKNKLKSFELLMRQIQDIVHSTYLRALGGAERRTLRQHTTVTETISPMMHMPQKKSGFSINPFRR